MSPHAAWPWLADAPLRNGVVLLSDPSPFERQYGAVRGKEERILSDAQVRMLPDGSGLWNADEWRIRIRSAERLALMLAEQGKAHHILEVGCGNGWLSALLQRNGHRVLGIDPFTAELEQAARAFPNGPTFARADLFTSPLPKGTFDAIIFAASIQYFGDASAALTRAQELLRKDGTVHVLDTVLYSSVADASAAHARSAKYYSGLGFPEMAANYHSHCLQTLLALANARVIDKPTPSQRLSKMFGRMPSPFTHVVIGGR